MYKCFYLWLCLNVSFSVSVYIYDFVYMALSFMLIIPYALIFLTLCLTISQFACIYAFVVANDFFAVVGELSSPQIHFMLLL